ncbi:MAG: hypothetical protein V4460_02545 [Pseudomonadota bacterium]|jgi:hypothetical protein|uniref:hypothetical protein n=1 Tax=Sphingomonas sp. PL20 TaxID=2760712 RepID=UPI001AE45F42
MTIQPNFIPSLMTDHPATRTWGIYSPLQDRWLDVIFTTEREAEEACQVIKYLPVRAKKAGSRFY